jgi:glycerate-2-kinase
MAETKIKNAAQLAQTPLRRTALAIVEAGLQAIDTESVIQRTVRREGDELMIDGERISLTGPGRILVAGVGKCAARAAAELERIMGDRLSAGFVITVGEVPPMQKVRVVQGTHPFPSQVNMDASHELLRFCSGLSEEDTVIFLVTGGGSTLLCLPDDGNWERESLIFGAFMNAGAPIQEINTVRKHMSRVRGGFLAQAMHPARVISLIMNDVPGSDDIGFIASGPTVLDTTTKEQAAEILARYRILQSCGLTGCGLMETPKDGKYFARVKNIVVVSNHTALDAMAGAARQAGYAPDIRDAKLSGEARDTGKRIAEELGRAAPKTALIYGGETTVTVRGSGKGGRNQELALGALASLPPDGALIASTSDGRDNTEYGGALCDILTTGRAKELGISPEEHLARSSSYDFWNAVGDYLLMGDTGSNVSDLIVAIRD